MIQVRAALTVIADDKALIDAYLDELLTPRKGLTVRMNSYSGESYDEPDYHASEGRPQ